jgi:peptidoglycan/xylan/chitin deacetylase (PgdA/CDA1 family)
MTAALLIETLNDFATRGVVADLWLRDDDAVAPTPALERLITLSRDFSVPMTLAVIPEPTSEELAQYLDTTDGIDVAVHGWAHRNHAGAEEKKRELGLHRPLETVVQELRQGFERLQTLHASRFVPMLVPPWNRIDDAIVERLADIGYKALSVFGPEGQAAVPLLNSHIDVIDWRGTRGGRDHDQLFAETAARIQVALDTGRTTGILTHHLDHDDSVWAFLEALFDITANHPGCRWRSSSTLINPLSP